MTCPCRVPLIELQTHVDKQRQRPGAALLQHEAREVDAGGVRGHSFDEPGAEIVASKTIAIPPITRSPALPRSQSNWDASPSSKASGTNALPLPQRRLAAISTLG